MCREIVAKVRRDYPEAGEAEILTATMERFVAKGEARKTGEGTYIMFVGRLPTTRKEQAS
jgi:hypothetical protein